MAVTESDSVTTYPKLHTYYSLKYCASEHIVSILTKTFVVLSSSINVQSSY